MAKAAKNLTSNSNRGQFIRKVVTFQWLKPVPRYIQRFPLISFILALVLLFGLIVLGNTVFKAKPVAETTATTAKPVATYNIGSAPKYTTQAQVDKTGVITIVAQTPGVIQSVNVKAGDHVAKGKNIVWISSNYQGGNAASISRQLAQKQNQITQDTYPIQKDLIKKQREVADKTETTSSDLRTINDQSRQDSQNLLDLNNQILDNINQDLKQYEATNSAGTNEQSIRNTRQLKAQVQSAVVQLSSQIRNLQYQSASDKAPAQLSSLQKEITLKQLEIQEKTLDISKEISQLQVYLAGISESLYYPVTPCGGIIQKVHVQVGQMVNPGTPIATISFDGQATNLIAKVPDTIAQTVSQYEPSLVHINGEIIEMYPSFVSSEATDGQLYSIIFNLPEDSNFKLTNQSYIKIELPIGVADSLAAMPYIPIDSVFQTQTDSYVFVVNSEKKAQSKSVKLGEVIGGYVYVLSGLDNGDQIITSRNVIAGDSIEVE